MRKQAPSTSSRRERFDKINNVCSIQLHSKAGVFSHKNRGDRKIRDYDFNEAGPCPVYLECV